MYTSTEQFRISSFFSWTVHPTKFHTIAMSVSVTPTLSVLRAEPEEGRSAVPTAVPRENLLWDAMADELGEPASPEFAY